MRVVPGLSRGNRALLPGRKNGASGGGLITTDRLATGRYVCAPPLIFNARGASAEPRLRVHAASVRSPTSACAGHRPIPCLESFPSKWPTSLVSTLAKRRCMAAARSSVRRSALIGPLRHCTVAPSGGAVVVDEGYFGGWLWFETSWGKETCNFLGHAAKSGEQQRVVASFEATGTAGLLP